MRATGTTFASTESRWGTSEGVGEARAALVSSLIVHPRQDRAAVLDGVRLPGAATLGALLDQLFLDRAWQQVGFEVWPRRIRPVRDVVEDETQHRRRRHRRRNQARQ
jgi:hypothetical protein